MADSAGTSKPKRKRKHKKRDPANKKLACPDCGRKFYFNCQLREHKLIHTGEKPYACDVCGKAFNTTYSLRTHKYIHTDEKPFKCSFCKYACRDTSTLRKHQAKHIGKQTVYQCKTCDKTYTDKWRLKNHVAETHLNMDIRTIPCNICNKLFKSRSQLTSHIKYVHDRTKSGHCPVCNVYLPNMHNLGAHLATHVDAKPYVCNSPGCTSAYKDRSSLTKHMVKHNPEQQYVCEICDRVFLRECRIKRHMLKVHAKRKCVECDYCGVEFYSKAYLINHITRKHTKKRKRYICDLCGLKTYNKPSIVMHLKYGHGNENDRKCKICHTVYKKYIYLKHHYKFVHKIAYKTKTRPTLVIKEEPPDDDISIHSIDLFEIEKTEVPDSTTAETESRTGLPELQTIIECERLGDIPQDVFDQFYVQTIKKIGLGEVKPRGPKTKHPENIDKKTLDYVKKSTIQILAEAKKKETMQELERARVFYNERMQNFVDKLTVEDDRNRKPIKVKMFKKKQASYSNVKEYKDDNNEHNIPHINSTAVTSNNDKTHKHSDETLIASSKTDKNTASTKCDDTINVLNGKDADYNEETTVNNEKTTLNNENQVLNDNEVEKNELENVNNETKIQETDDKESFTADDTSKEKWNCKKKKNSSKIKLNSHNNEETTINNENQTVDDNEVHKISNVEKNKLRNINDETRLSEADDKESSTAGGTTSEDEDDEEWNYKKKKKSSKINFNAHNNEVDITSNVKNNELGNINDETKLQEDDKESTEGDTASEDDEEWNCKKNKKNSKINFNSHQCYICFKLYETKQKLLDHCKDHFDVCNDRFLKKCPLCPYVTNLNIPRHLRLKHGVKLKIPYGKIKDKKDNTDGCRYYFEIDDPRIQKMEVIPSVKNLNKLACMKIDKKNREEKYKALAKTKLVRKGKEWVIETEKINIDKDVIMPKFDSDAINNLNIKIGDSDGYFDSLKKMYHIAKKSGKSMLFPCQSCDKVCRNLAALKLHNRKHEDNPKPFRKKVWKHKLKENVTDKKKTVARKRETGNRTAKPKPIKNKHKCDPELKDFYKNNITGGDIEFWQFLKIFNKMSRDNIKDFKDLEGRHEYGLENPNMVEEDAIETTNCKNDKGNTDGDNLDISRKFKRKKQSKFLQKAKYKNGKDDKYKRVIRISKEDYNKRNAIKQKLREKILQCGDGTE